MFNKMVLHIYAVKKLLSAAKIILVHKA